MTARPFPVVYAEVRADGWPFCPRCEEDELWGAWEREDETPRTFAGCEIVGCYACGWTPGTDPRPVMRTR